MSNWHNLKYLQNRWYGDPEYRARKRLQATQHLQRDRALYNLGNTEPRWSADQKRRLIAMVKQGGLSMSKMGIVLGVTRNSVAGQMRRLRREGLLP